MKKIIYVGDDGYMVLGTVSASTDLSNDELKQQYGLADTILRNKDQLYVCMKLIDAEWEEIKGLDMSEIPEEERLQERGW